MEGSKTLQRRFNYILFDLGNTLFYFDGSWENVLNEGYRAVAMTLVNMGYLAAPDEFLKRFTRQMEIYSRERDVTCVEQTSLAVLRHTLREFVPAPVEPEVLRRAINALYEVSERHWFIEEDTFEMLQTLRAEGYRLGIISNAADAQDVNVLIDRANLRSFFDQVIISAEFGLRKPHPKIFRKALNFWQAAPAETVMVGDTLPADILG
ncbi:MAG: HAD-IA family hydrolase, partial [Anaerolineae bacterium]|nr:HAD-IA family hydrolase [Anaerolineae bacterium]